MPSLSNESKVSLANSIMQTMNSLACSCLMGRIDAVCMPEWHDMDDLHDIYCACEAWQDYLKSLGINHEPQKLMGDLILDMIPNDCDIVN